MTTLITLRHTLIGAALLTCLIGFAVPIGMIVLKTDQKPAVHDDPSIRDPFVQAIASSGFDAEEAIEQTGLGESNPYQDAEEDFQILRESPFERLLASITEPFMERIIDPALESSSLSYQRPGDELVFDLPSGDADLVIDPALLYSPENERPAGILAVETGTPNATKRKGNARGEKFSHTPKGTLHQMALFSKDPTVTRGLDPTSPEVIVGREGSRITIPGGSLVFEDGTPCMGPYDAKIWEFYDFSDILLSGLTTMSDQGPLQTGGMAYVEVNSKGRKLNLAKGSEALISFAPFYRTDSDFGLYNGDLANKQILWRKVEQETKKQTVDHSRISVSQVPDSLRKLSQFGNLVCLMNEEYLVDETEFFGKEMQNESFTGPAMARFPDGTAILFDGHLEITKSKQNVGGSADRSVLETRFKGKSLLAFAPASNPKSSFKVFLPKEGFPVPFISRTNSGQPSVFSYRKGNLTSVESIHGDLGFLSTKKRVSLSGQSFSYEKRIGGGSMDRTSALSSVFSNRDILGDCGKEGFSAMEHLNDQALAKGEALVRKFARAKAMQNTVFTNFNARNPLLNPRANLLFNSSRTNPANRDLAAWENLLEHLDELGQIATATGNQDAAEKFSQTRDRLDTMAEEAQVGAQIAAQAVLQANLGFRREFISPNLGWHNLDRPRSRRSTRTYELASNELNVSTSLEETNSSIGVGPFYFSVWPQDRVSMVAGLGDNTIPRGAFTSMGYLITEDGRIFADVARGAGRKVSLDLKEMDKEDFRKKVKNFF